MRALGSAERDLLIRTIVGEAADQGPLGQAAVAHVVLNRLNAGKWGGTVPEVVFAKRQFEPWETRRDELLALSPESPAYRQAADVVDLAAEGYVPDPTGGALNFLNEKIVRKRRPAGDLPKWASGKGIQIGEHTFYGGSGDTTLAGSSGKDWWAADPVASQPKATAGGNWWSADREVSAVPRTTGPLPTIREDAGLPASDRFALGVKVTPEGKAGYLESRFGKDNVVTDEAGNFYVRAPGSKDFARVDPAGLDVYDIPQAVGEYGIETGATIAAGTNPLAVAGAAGAGNAVRQGLSALLPGDDRMTVPQRIGSAALHAGVGGGTQAGVNAVLGRGVDLVSPHNIIARHLNRQMQRPEAVAGQQIEADLGPGFPGLSPGQMTQSRPILTMEGLARRHPASGHIVQAFNDAQLEALHQRTLGFVDRMRGVPLSGSMVTGQAVENSFNQVLGRALNARRAAATRDFGALEAAAGGQRVVPVQNVLGEIDNLVREFDVPGGGDASAAVVNRLQALRRAWAGTPERTAESAVLDAAGRPIATTTPAEPHQITGQQAQRLLQIYTNAAQGSGRIFQDIDTAQQRLIARRVLNAFRRDLDEAADAGGASGAVADALRTARNNYRANSQAIDALGESVLGRLLGDRSGRAPEDIAGAMLRMEPSELRASFNVLDQHDPATAQRVKALFFEDALQKAGAPRTQTAPRGQTVAEEFSAARMVTALRKSQVWDVLTVPERAEATTIFRGLQRIAHREGEGSPTAPLQFALDLAKGFMGGLTSPTQMVGTAASVLGPQRLARAMTDPAARQQMRTLVENAGATGPRARKAEAAMTYLASRYFTDPEASNVRPITPAHLAPDVPDLAP